MARPGSSKRLPLLVAALSSCALLASGQVAADAALALAEDDPCLGEGCGLGLLQTSVEHQESVGLERGHSVLSHADPRASVPKRVLNETLSDQFLLQLEYELQVDEGLGVKSPVVLVLLEVLGFGLCGCDRCYMGQPGLGCIKGLTVGGVFIWAIVDYVAVIVTCLSLSPGIDVLGMQAAFPSHAVFAAFIICLVFLTCKCFLGTREFQKMTSGQRRLGEQQMVLMFAGWDKNADGFLTPEELIRALNYIGVYIDDKKIQQYISEVGIAADGRVDYRAFARVLSNK
mmetsp:Transcript_69901/g.183323  ORF Transcript_69901/g.183323 Transcript_69901/m.183323 type:complete len:286 (-) Transcript_69901:147-1004(-)